MSIHRFALILTAVICCPAALPAQDLKLQMRQRERPADGAAFKTVLKQAAWKPKQTAIIVCDVWDSHHCLNAVRRVEEIAPRMNQVLEKARGMGVFIIHAPSSCMPAYVKHPGRKLAQASPMVAQLPADIAKWCYKIPSEEQGVYPLDQTDGGCDTDPVEQEAWQAKLKAMGRNPKAPWLAQIDTVKIHDGDAISDSGVEIWNLLSERGIDNVILLGVHTNMCVLGRPFGLRQMAKNGKNVVLMRDMTDTMYNPQRWPYVSHFQGTDLIVQHIEKFVCPTITSDQLLGGVPFKFKGDRRPKAVVAIAESEYGTHETLALFAQRVLQEQLGMQPVILHGSTKDHVIPGLAEALEDAELLVLSIRRIALPEKDMAALKRYLDAGKPLVGIRTACHAFDARGKHPAGFVEWTDLDPQVFGGNYRNHYPVGPVTTVTVAEGAVKNPILTGVAPSFPSQASLYKTSPLAKSTTLLLVGTIPGQQPEPIAWTNTYKKARVFFTSLGARSDFENASFERLLGNAARWAVNMRIASPSGGEG